ncbi:MAG: hypothetical protein IPP49_07165 [Saprospiraceae bacterium]|nr:hypothetical protein [Saprospiraceae bacterium]
MGSRIARFVMTEKNQPVSNVNVNIVPTLQSMSKTVSTAVAGTYDMMVASGLDCIRLRRAKTEITSMEWHT